MQRDDHGALSKESTVVTSISVMAYEHRTDDSWAQKKDNSDAESYHSAVTSVARRSSRSQPQNRQQSRVRQMSPEAEGGDSSPQTRTRRSSESGSSSNARRRKSQPKVPRRKSSRPQTKPVSKHRQACELFSSLDAMLTLSRDFTPLSSVGSSRPTTRQASLTPDEPTAPVVDLFQAIDAKLATTHLHAFPSHSTSTLINTDSPGRQSFEVGDRPQAPFLESFFGSENSETPPPSGRRSRQHSLGVTTEASIPLKISAVYAEPSPRPSHAPVVRPSFNTVMSWTSDATRQAEYDKIDRAHSGIRGFLRRALPGCVQAKTARRDFYSGRCDGDSVRRFRLDGPDHSVSSHNLAQTSMRENSAEQKYMEAARKELAETYGSGGVQRKWSCF